MKARTFVWSSLVIVIILALASRGDGLPARAQVPDRTFIVNSTADAGDSKPRDGVCATNNGECTLRAAIQEANAQNGDDTIILPVGIYVLTQTGSNEDSAHTGDLDITDDLTIIGEGAGATIVDGNQLDRVFHIPARTDTLTVTISGITIQNGTVHVGMYEPDAGGGILIQPYRHRVTLRDCLITNNSAGHGGGIHTYLDFLRLESSTVSDNVADDGGGIYNNEGSVTVINGTISDNTAQDGSGGGIRNESGHITATNSTISENTTYGDGGGIYSDGGGVTVVNSTVTSNRAPTMYGSGGGIWSGEDTTLTLANCTVAGNNAYSGGGIVGYNAILKNSIIANNTGGGAPDCNGGISSTGYNLIGSTTGCGYEPATGDLANVDAQLGPLQDNGGDTLTHALLPDSPAIDAGNPDGCTDISNEEPLTTDQRGSPRPVDGDGDGRAICDIGAYEVLEFDYHISGQVFEGEVGDESSPISGVTVYLYGADSSEETNRTFITNTDTDDQGRYTLTVSSGTEYNFYYIREHDLSGYISVGATSISGTVQTDNKNWIEYAGPLWGKTLTGNKFWDVVPTLSGNVYEGDAPDASRPLGGATVELFCASDASNQGTRIASAVTGSEGQYALTVSSVCAYYNILKTHLPGYTSAGATSDGGVVVRNDWIRYTDPLQGKALTNNNFWDKRSWTFEGRVYVNDDDGTSSPLPGVTVSVYGADSPYPSTGVWIASDATDGNGWYHLESADGYAIYSIRKTNPPGYKPATATTEDGIVRTSDWIEYVAPLGNKTLIDAEFWLTPPEPMLPDLMVRPITAWGFEEQKQVLALTVEIANRGNASSGATQVSISNPNQGWIGPQGSVPGLSSAETVTVELRMQIPAEQRGKTHTFLTTVDPQERITEHDEENNTTETPEIPIPRELNITGVTPDEGRRGDEVVMTIYGENFTPETRVRIPFDVTTLHVQLVDPGKLQVRIAIADDARLGSRPVSVSAPETPGATLYDAFTLLDRTMPDLVVSTISGKVSDDDQFLLLYVEIRNDGTGETPQTDVQAEEPARGWVSERVSVPGLEPGDGATIEIRMKIPDEQRGMEHTFEVKVDPNERIPESNEENNAGTTPPIEIPVRPISPVAVAAMAAAVAAAAGGGAFAAYRFVKGRPQKPPGEQPPKKKPKPIPVFPPLRLLRIWLTEGSFGTGRVLTDRDSLTVGDTYSLQVQIQPRIIKTAGQDDVVSQQGPGQYVQLDVVFFSPETDFKLATRAATLNLPLRGASNQIRCPIEPYQAGRRRLRVCIYYRNVLLQSALLDASVVRRGARAAGTDPGRYATSITRTTDYVASSGLVALEELPRPALNIFTNQASDGTHWIGAFASGGAAGFRLRNGDMHTFGPGELATIAEKTRDLLAEVEGKKVYRLAITSPVEIQGQLDRFENDMVKLAVNGYTLYDTLFFSRLGAAARIDRMQSLEDTLQDPSIISVARCRGESTTIPWAALYSRYLDTDKMRTGEIKLCRIFKAQLAANKWSAGLTELVEKHDLLDDPVKCRNNPHCPLRGGEDGLTVCPFGFWGLLHQIEQPLQDVVATSVDQVPQEMKSPKFNQTSFLVRSRDEELRFAIAAYPAIPNVASHKEEFEILGQGGRMQVTYEEERDKVMSILRPGGQHLYYFYCHGEMQDRAFKLKLGPVRDPGYIAAADLAYSWRRRWPDQPQPLVILNACESIALVPERIHGFLGKLRLLGACGVVGSEIKVWTQLAQPFGSQLVKQILKGRSIGEAFLDVRRHLLRQCNPLGLVYNHYSPATLHLHDPDNCAWCRAHPPGRVSGGSNQP